MNTKVLEYIIAIAEEGSISKAAERYYLSHVALSRHLKNIEAELGTPLFQRSSSGMRLTRAGILYVNDARAVLHLEKQMEQELSALRHRGEKPIRVMVDTHFYNRFARLVEPAYQQTHPDRSLEISACNAAQAQRSLLDGAADVALFDSYTAQSQELEYLAFAKVDMLLAFPKDFPYTTDLNGLQKALANGMFMALYPTGHTIRTMQEQKLVEEKIFPERILECGVHTAILQIQAGNTCGILPSVSCGTDVRAKIRVGTPFYSVYNVIAQNPGSVRDRSTQTLIEEIIRNMED